MKKEIIFAALSALSGQGGICIATYKKLSSLRIEEGNIQTAIKDLENDNKIKRISKDGYYPEFIVYNPIPCPSFVFDKRLTSASKVFLMNCFGKIDTNNSNTKNAKLIELDNVYSFSTKIKKVEAQTAVEFWEYFKNITFIKTSIENTDEIHNGHQLKQTKKYCCKYCGTDDHNKFTRNKSVCNSCRSKRTINNLTIEQKLLRNTKLAKNKNSMKISTLTEEIILNKLKMQEYKCFYSGLDLTKETASVDRVNSNLPYIEENIVICHKDINIMKNAYTKEYFLKLVKLVNEHSNL